MAADEQFRRGEFRPLLEWLREQGMVYQGRLEPPKGKTPEEIRKTLPPDLKLENSYDISQFIEESIHEVYRTLIIALALVVAIIYLFLGNMRAVIVPTVAVPVPPASFCPMMRAR